MKFKKLVKNVLPLKILTFSALYIRFVKNQSIKSKLINDYYYLNYRKKYFFEDNPKLNELHLKKAFKYSQSNNYPIPKTVAKNLDIVKALDYNNTYYAASDKYFNNRKIGLDYIILFIHGGGFFFNPTSQHLLFIRKLANKANAKVIMPIYPKAPAYSHKEMYHFLYQIYTDTITRFTAEKVIVIAEEAGATLALELACKARHDGIEPVKEMILLTPLSDVTLQDKRLKKADSSDFKIDLHSLKKQVNYYADDLKLNNPIINPYYNDLDIGTKISIFNSTSSILNIDSLNLQRKITKQGLHLDYFEYPNMQYQFMFDSTLESNKFYDDLLKVITRPRVKPNELKIVNDKKFIDNLKVAIKKG
ncbi:alpha/beta hydrolase fold domain-containing protein [Mycoplasma sp. P36-A1]|uniref:alpha/beta hydrolase fold domain-containing protein n=1 Tax=Mycoplasma sp. P36-A1 TaxID=3252900 RepID=UPI003C2EB1AC